MRCAIYTRKSGDESADADYSTLDNQRAYCSAYIASQGGQGWAELPKRYDDGGYSGGNLNRPAMTRLRADVRAGLIDVVVVYKIDRMSRSLRDFANLVAEFESAGVTFVSVTQAMDTGTSMGRLTLNVLLSFAQFERELTSERLSDWFSAAARKGLWTRQRPFGYAKTPEGRLIPHPTEAETVRRIFRRYIATQSSARVADELFADGVVNTRGSPITGHAVLHIIRHPIYSGQMIHRDSVFPGGHEAIVGPRLWRRAQQALSQSRWIARKDKTSPIPAMLKGLAYDRSGHRMHHTHCHARGRLYRYYVAGSERRRYGPTSDAYMRFRAGDLEEAVIEAVDRITGMRWRDRQRQDTTEALRRYLTRIDIDPDQMTLHFRTGATVIATPGGRIKPRS